MAHVLRSLVGESSSTTGTGAITLAAALTNHRRFNTICSTGDTVDYRIRHATDGTWETGIGTYSSADTLTRSFPEDGSSGVTTLVTFASGGLEVVMTPRASKLNSLTGIPLVSKSAAYTLVMEDAGGGVLHPAADTTARTMTIPANSSVPYPLFTALTFANENGAGVMTIAITTDTMRLAGAGTTGSRTLAANGIATAVKITSTSWLISGTGLT